MRERERERVKINVPIGVDLVFQSRTANSSWREGGREGGREEKNKKIVQFKPVHVYVYVYV